MWLNSKIRDLIKTPGYGKHKPFKVIGIFSDSELKEVTGGFISDIVLLENNKEYSLALKPFTDKLIK